MADRIPRHGCKYLILLVIPIGQSVSLADRLGDVADRLGDVADRLGDVADRLGDVADNLSSDELAFYDSLEANDGAMKVLGNDTLKNIARELVETVHRNVTIDWTVKESVCAKLRIIVNRILFKYGYPPDKQVSAINTFLQQAELLPDFWTEGASV
jgi:hypothetical protein